MFSIVTILIFCFTLIFTIITILGGCLFLICLIWRFFSYKKELPCPSWLSRLLEKDNPFTKANQVPTLIESLELKLGMTVLDAGCGPGRLTIPIAQKIGPEGLITALDMQPSMLARVKAKAQAAELSNIEYFQAKLGNGNFEQNRFDRALLVTVAGEIPQREQAFIEIFKALKPGGVLLVTESRFDPHFQNQRIIRQLANATGFLEKKAFGNFFAFTILLEKSDAKRIN